jgi:2-polyprenyl-3-methyl-5-hydroxy-6-metoxy-1,4-benzoquinol methylase
MISLVIPAYGHPDSTLAILEAVAETTEDLHLPYELLLAETLPATPEHEALYASLSGDLEISRTQSERSASSAINDGASKAKGEILVVLEPGVKPAPGWIAHLLASLQAGYDLVSSILIDRKNALVRGPFGFRESFAGDVVVVPAYRGLSAEDPILAKCRPCHGASGGAVAVRSTTWLALDGMEAGLDGTWGWLDLGLRATQAGYKLAVDGRARLLDCGDGSLTPYGEYLYGERFRERWSGEAPSDVFDLHRTDGLRLAGVRGPGDKLERMVLQRSDGSVVESGHLEAPWPPDLLFKLDDGRAAVMSLDGTFAWPVAGGAVDRHGELASHYESSAQDGLAPTHKFFLDHVPDGARVLEIGCASGYTTRRLVEKGCTVVAIEIDPVAAAKAAEAAERVIVGDLDVLQVDEILAGETFDAMVAGDVLEHLREPGRLLEQVRRLLGPDGAVLASVPNIAHASVRCALAMGQWRYRKAGILDGTHRRFFTQWSLRETLRRAGYRIDKISTTRADMGSVEIQTPAELLPAGFLEFLASEPEATVYQFVFRAVPDGSARKAAVDDQRLAGHEQVLAKEQV